MTIKSILNDTFVLTGITTINEFAKYARISARTINRWLKGDNLPHVNTIEDLYKELSFKYPQYKEELFLLKDEMIKTCKRFKCKSPQSKMAKAKVLQRSSDKFILGKNFKFDTQSLNNARNNNVMVVGMSGKGKTSCIVQPNLLQRNAAFIVADAKGQIVNDIGGILSEPGIDDNGYDIRILNLKNPETSFHYNPFRYIRNQNDIIALSRIIALHDCDGSRTITTESYWQNVSSQLITALIYYLWKYCPVETQNFPMLLKLMELSNKKVNDDVTQLDMLFCKYIDNDVFLASQAGSFLSAHERTKDSIITVTNTALAPFSDSSILELLKYDELNLEDFATLQLNKKIPSLFVICDDVHSNKNFISCMLYKQMFEILCEKADFNNGSLNFPVRFFLDDFATIGEIPDFGILISNMRSRNMSVILMIQDEQQLEVVYGKQNEVILENCNHYVYLGGNSLVQHKKIKERFGIRMFIKNRKKNLYLIDNTKSLYNVYPLHYKKHINYYDCPFDYQEYIKSRVNNSCECKTTCLDFIDMFIDSRDINEIFTKRDGVFDSCSEEVLYIILSSRLGSKDILVPHFHLNELIKIEEINSIETRKSISMMHCDFVLFDDSYRPLLAIEVDGNHHKTEKLQIKRDCLKNKILNEINLPLFRIDAENVFDKRKVADFIELVLSEREKIMSAKCFTYGS